MWSTINDPLRLPERKPGDLIRRSLGGLVAAGAALLAGAGSAVSPIMVVAPLFLGILLLATALAPESPWRLVGLSTIVVSPQIFSPTGDEPVPNGDAAQKAILILGLLCLVISLGMRLTTIGVAAITVISVMAAVTLLRIGDHIEVWPAPAIRAALGFILPWAFLLVNWRKIGYSTMLTYLAGLPTLSLLVGGLFQLAGVTTVIRVEATGAARLQGAAVPAHLAMIGLVGLVASLLLLARHRNVSGSLTQRVVTVAGAALNLGVVLGTATRGPILVAGLVVATFVWRALMPRTDLDSKARRSAWQLLAAGAAALVLALPVLLLRTTGNSYEGPINTSGREQAWRFFLDVGAESPWTGRGLGFSPLAVELLKPRGVQTAFIAPHNEYIHLYVDGGYPLAVGLLGCLAIAFAVAARAQTGSSRWIVIALGLGTAFYSFVDNTVSSPQYTVLLLILLGTLIFHPHGSTPVAPEPARPHPDRAPAERNLQPARGGGPS